MARKGRGGSLPRWHKGKLIYDDIDGWFYGSRENKLFKRRGLMVSKKNWDTLTDEERENQVQQRMMR